MSKLKALGIFLVGAVFFGSVAYGQSIPSQSPWVYNASNQITQIVANSVIKITGLSDGCLALSSSLLVSSGSPCGTGGGSTPGGTSGQVQYNANGTFGGVSTTTLVAGTNVTFSGGPVSVIGTSPLTINSSGGGTSFGYPFPGNATTTNITFTGGITGNVNGSITGNANTATALQTGRSINGVNFDGTQNITIFAASSTLLANNNTFSGNNIFSNIITGSISGSAGSVANAVTFNNSGSGAASGQTYNGSSAQTISYNTLGAQVSGNYITALTGDVTATGPGSVAATLATVNGNVGAFTNANITVNAKGLITAASNGAGSVSTVATSSSETSTYFPYWTSTNGTPALLGTTKQSTDAFRWIDNGGSFTTLVGTSSASSAKLEINNNDPTSVRGMLRIISNSAQGADYDIRIDSGNPDIEMVDTSQVSPAGKYELAIDNGIFHINSRNSTDSSFQPDLSVYQYSAGGQVGIGTVFNVPQAKLEVVATSTVPSVFELSSGTGNNGDIFKALNTGEVGIGTTTPYAGVPLTVFGFGGPEQIFNNNNNSSLWTRYDKKGTTVGYVGFGGAGDLFTNGLTDGIDIRGQNSVQLGHGNTASLTIASTNNVGISTTTPTPTASLAIQGNQYTSGSSFFGGNILATSTISFTGLTTGTGNGALCLTTAGIVEYSAGANCVAGNAGTITSIATNNGLTGGTITTTGTIGLATINAGVLGAVTSATVPTSQATSTLYGAASTGGFVLQWSNVTNGLVLAATSSSGGSGITAITGPTGLTFSGSPTSVGTLGTGFSIKELPTIVVAASGGDTNSIQTALNTCGTLGGANIVLTDPLYNIGGTGLTWKGSNCQIWGRGPGTTTISFTGATTAISASNIAACQANINVCYTQNEIHNVFFSGDGNASGVAIDWTDMSHGLVDDVQTSDVGTSLRVTDNQTSVGGVTFYNKFTNLDLNDNHKFCIDASSTNPVNGNTFDNIFCGDAATANVTGLNMNNGNGDLFNMIFMEPGSITGTIGMNIFDNTLSTNNGVFNNTFSNWYVEANATGIKIATTVHPSAGGIQRNTLSNMTVEANTTDWNVAAGAAVLNTINGYDSNFGAPITSLQGPVGISTSTELQAIGATPWAYLGVNASSSVSANEFVVDQNNASGQYRTDLLLNNTGYLGLGGSVTPSSRLTVTDQTTGDALLPTVLITGNTNFAKTGDLLKVSNNNGSDSGTTTQIINVGTGPSFEVDDQANDTTPFVVNAAGNVGIGSTTPNATLSINAVAQSNPFFEIGSTTSDLVSIKPSTSLAFGIGTSSPWRTLSVEGTVALHNLTTGTAGTPICINTSGEIVSAGGTTCLTSSKYTKEDIQPLDLDALAETMKLQVKQFAYLDTPTVTHYGLIAEDVQQIDPDLVAHTAITMVLDGHTFNIGDPIAIDSEHLADGLLVKDIQQLQGEILTLQPGRDVEENWQWLVIGILVIWNISLTLRRRK